MSAKDLKAIMHHRQMLVAQLENSLAKVKAGQRGISTDELEVKMRQWRTGRNHER